VLMIGGSELCAGCELRRSCGRAGAQPRKIEATDNIGVEKDDIVKVVLSPYRYLLSAFVIFILPILFMVLFYYLGKIVSLSENNSVLLAFAGLALYFILLIPLRNKLTTLAKAKVIEQVASNK